MKKVIQIKLWDWEGADEIATLMGPADANLDALLKEFEGVFEYKRKPSSHNILSQDRRAVNEEFKVLRTQWRKKAVKMGFLEPTNDKWESQEFSDGTFLYCFAQWLLSKEGFEDIEVDSTGYSLKGL